jgi:hypothetical protein
MRVERMKRRCFWAGWETENGSEVQDTPGSKRVSHAAVTF